MSRRRKAKKPSLKKYKPRVSGKAKRTYPFKTGQKVYVVPPGAHSYIGEILEVDRKKHGKKYDIAIQEMDGGRVRYANPGWVFKKIPPQFKPSRGRVHDPSKRDGGVIVDAPSDKRVDAWRGKLDEWLKHDENLARSKKYPACRGCNNGFIYVAGGRGMVRDRLERHFKLDSLKSYKHIILVPPKMFLGRVPLKYRYVCDSCDRCRHGTIVKLKKGTKSGSFDHTGLLKAGFVAVILVK